jgi:hypothetical protein
MALTLADLNLAGVRQSHTLPAHTWA